MSLTEKDKHRIYRTTLHEMRENPFVELAALGERDEILVHAEEILAQSGPAAGPLHATQKQKDEAIYGDVIRRIMLQTMRKAAANAIPDLRKEIEAEEEMIAKVLTELDTLLAKRAHLLPPSITTNLWRSGADVMISGEPVQNTSKTVVVTPYWRELSRLFIKIRDITTALWGQSKYWFFGTMAEAALACGETDWPTMRTAVIKSVIGMVDGRIRKDVENKRKHIEAMEKFSQGENCDF